MAGWPAEQRELCERRDSAGDCSGGVWRGLMTARCGRRMPWGQRTLRLTAVVTPRTEVRGRRRPSVMTGTDTTRVCLTRRCGAPRSVIMRVGMAWPAASSWLLCLGGVTTSSGGCLWQRCVQHPQQPWSSAQCATRRSSAGMVRRPAHRGVVVSHDAVHSEHA